MKRSPPTRPVLGTAPIEVPAPVLSAPEASGGNAVLGVINDYIALTKPRIISLLLVTALGGMFAAARGIPDATLVLVVLLGGSLGAGGANALNHYLDRDIDLRMGRTKGRPLPGNRISPANALVFGIVLNVLAFALLWAGANLLSAALTLGATLFYVLVYTKWLKRSTTQNIVIGGAAGAVPPLVGWAAVTGSLALQPLYLFAFIFFWTPPHFWALALLIEGDYAKAGVPMLPVALGHQVTGKSIMLHSVTLVTLSVLYMTLPGVGMVYVVSALALGVVFLALAARVLMSPTKPKALQLYLYSLLYLALLFVAVMVDSVRGGLV